METDRHSNRSELKAVRRDLRNRATVVERLLWRGLRGRRLANRKFRRQHSVGRYVLDFYCPAEKLGIELDGSVHEDPSRAAYDSERQRVLEAQGIRVLRFQNKAVLEAPDAVLAAIAEALDDSEGWRS